MALRYTARLGTARVWGGRGGCRPAPTAEMPAKWAEFPPTPGSAADEYGSPRVPGSGRSAAERVRQHGVGSGRHSERSHRLPVDRHRLRRLQHRLRGGARADCVVPGQVYGDRNSPSGGFPWFDAASYTQASAYAFGSCGRRSFDLRAEFINLTNTPILNSPNRGLGPTLGLLQSSQGARNVQIALQYRF